MKKEPGLTLRELKEKMLSQKKKPVSIVALGATLQREGLRRKKTIVGTERNNRKRAGYWRRVKRIAAKRLKFVDEAGFNRAMTRLWGRTPRGERGKESVPRNFGANVSALSVMSLERVEATMTIDGSVDGEDFNVFAEQFIRPGLETGGYLVLDNLGVHRASRIEQIAENRGAKVVWLAPYSPDFSPIELMRSKLKTLFRANKARTREEIEVRRALTAFFGNFFLVNGFDARPNVVNFAPRAGRTDDNRTDFVDSDRNDFFALVGERKSKIQLPQLVAYGDYLDNLFAVRNICQSGSCRRHRSWQ